MAAKGHNVSRRTVLGAGAAAGLAAVAGTSAATSGRKAEAPVPPPAAPAPGTASCRIEIVCSTCGGDSVTRDAWAEWDAETQDWVLGAAFDYAYCHDCDEETRLEEVELEPG
jgi:hypothetical protein